MMNTWLVFHEISQPHGAALLMWDLVDLAVRKRTAPSLQTWDIGLWGKRGGEKGKFVGNDIAEVEGWGCLISLPLIPTLLSSTARLLIPFQGVASFFLFYFSRKREERKKKLRVSWHRCYLSTPQRVLPRWILFYVWNVCVNFQEWSPCCRLTLMHCDHGFSSVKCFYTPLP